MKNNAKIEVEGPLAQSVAGSVLDSLSLDPCEVRKLNVSLHTIPDDTDCTEKTKTSFETQGPNAGAVASQMIGGIDNGDHDANYIRVEVMAVDETQSADEVADSSADSDASGTAADGRVMDTEIVHAERDQPSSLRPDITKDMPDNFGTVVSPADERRELSKNTEKYRVLAFLAAFHLEQPDQCPVTHRELAEYYEHRGKEPSSVSSNLSILFRKDGYLRRRRRDQDTGGVQLQYQMNEAAWDELDRLGWPDDLDPVDNRRNGHMENALPTIEN